MRPISNLNSVSIKNYLPQAETLAIIRELTKLGLIKTKSKSKKERKPKMIEDLKQESDMVGYTKTLGGSAGQFPLRLITPGMTQQQIEDINRSNAANVAALRGEVQQQRFEDIQRIGTAVGQIVNPIMERFRGSTFPAQAQGDQPIDPFFTRRPGVIYVGDTQDTQDVPMSRTPNPNAPEFTSEYADNTFPDVESENVGIPIAPPNLQPREKVGGAMSSSSAEALNLSPEFIKTVKLNDAADSLGLKPMPNFKKAKLPIVKKYYNDLTDKLRIDEIITEASKEEFENEIKAILEGYISE